MKGEISRLNRLVGDFLSFGKPMRLDSRLCAVDEVLQEVASLVEHKAKDQGILLTVDAEPDLPRVVVDPELLKTCFLNLMINAVDSMPGGGVLSVSIHRESNGGPPELCVEVKDTGKGMTPEEIRTAFEPYFSTKDTGLGLGLALTHKIVADHGGAITLESAPDRGTTARVSLPIEPALPRRRRARRRSCAHEAAHPRGRRRAPPARHPADDPGGRGLRGRRRRQRPPGPGGGAGRLLRRRAHRPQDARPERHRCSSGSCSGSSPGSA